MPVTKEPKTTNTPTQDEFHEAFAPSFCGREIAEKAAERYFAALAGELPGSQAPGDVDLSAVLLEIEQAVEADRRTFIRNFDENERRAASAQAGYLLGICIGRRLAAVQR